MPVALGTVASHHVAATFDPLSIVWHSGFWASDPDWTPPADAGVVTSWRNAGTCAADATQGTAPYQPTYRAAYANLNGKPAIEWGDTVGQFLASNSPLIAQPNHIFAVGWLSSTAPSAATVCDSPGNRHLLRNYGGVVTMYAGAATNVTDAGRTATPYALFALFNDAASTCRMNGTDYTVPSGVSTMGFDYVRVGGYDTSPGYNHKGALAFLGVKDSALTGPEIASLEAWAETFYGVSIA